MLIIPEITRIARRREPNGATPTAALRLVVASYDDDVATLSMTFDRAITIDDYDGGSTYANLPAIGVLVAADTGPHLSPDGRTLVAECESLQPAEGPTAWLTVPANSGIVDAATGAAWAGVTEWPLPFGPGIDRLPLAMNGETTRTTTTMTANDAGR